MQCGEVNVDEESLVALFDGHLLILVLFLSCCLPSLFKAGNVLSVGTVDHELL